MIYINQCGSHSESIYISVFRRRTCPVRSIAFLKNTHPSTKAIILRALPLRPEIQAQTKRDLNASVLSFTLSINKEKMNLHLFSPASLYFLNLHPPSPNNCKSMDSQKAQSNHPLFQDENIYHKHCLIVQSIQTTCPLALPSPIIIPIPPNKTIQMKPQEPPANPNNSHIALTALPPTAHTTAAPTPTLTTLFQPTL